MEPDSIRKRCFLGEAVRLDLEKGVSEDMDKNRLRPRGVRIGFTTGLRKPKSWDKALGRRYFPGAKRSEGQPEQTLHLVQMCQPSFVTGNESVKDSTNTSHNI
jgi:hypothetical protein